MKSIDWTSFKSYFFSVFTKDMLKIFAGGLGSSAVLVMLESFSYFNAFFNTPFISTSFAIGVVIIFFCIVTALLINSLYEVKLEKIKELTSRDELTHLYNKNEFESKVTYELQNSIRYQQNLSLIMLNIDKFRVVNESYSYQQGKSLLRELSYIIKQEVRDLDIVFKYSDVDDFAIVLSRTASIDAKIIADRIRNKVDNHDFYNIKNENSAISITISLGITGFSYDNHDTNEKVNESMKTEFVDKAINQLQIAKLKKNDISVDSVSVNNTNFIDLVHSEWR